jgi:transcriptional regulator with XRE-family HTH domain
MRRVHGIARRRRSPAEIRQLLEEYERLGLTQQAFAERVGVSLASVSTWLRKARNGELREAEELLPARSRLVPVTIRSTATSSFELVIWGGVTLRVPADFDSAALERLLALLQDRC